MPKPRHNTVTTLADDTAKISFGTEHEGTVKKLEIYINNTPILNLDVLSLIKINVDKRINNESQFPKLTPLNI